MNRTITFFLIFINVACETGTKNESNLVNSDTVGYNDGYLVKFYSNDSAKFDSTHRYMYEFDSLFLTNRVIIENDDETSNIIIKKINDSIRITLNNPQYEYLALVNKDTVVWGPNYPSSTLTIAKNDSILLYDAYVQNWGIIGLSDTLGSAGIQLNKLIKIKNGW